MVKLIFTLSGSPIATIRSDCVPPAGSAVIIRTDNYKKGLVPGSLIRFTVEDEHFDPTVFDFTKENTTVYLDINGYELLEEGPQLDR
ncbi:hypothetical protein [Gluconacetobacter entanii]|nr:hypothetical protein [Gluconacetobacter entanii]MCW4579112.1 hypothetical protein [Gluconacetobacter entanii]MCW4585886.1 hypothetical protein [Gluconacetobacter entanii]